MKNIFFFFALLFTAHSATAQTSSLVKTYIRAEETLRVGTVSSQAVTGFNTTIPSVATNDKLPTTKAVKDYVNASFVPLGGTASGDLSGTWPSPTVDGLQGVAVSAVAPTTGQVLKYNGTAWAAGSENDPSVTNELQTISSTPNLLTLSSGGGTVAVDTDPENDITGVVASGSVFFTGAGASVDPAVSSGSNFLGQNAGDLATNAAGSNFFGSSAGQNATNAAGSNFIGASAGYAAADASSSNFFGYNAGAGATTANNSNFFGSLSGADAANAQNSNFFGNSAGNGATNAQNSNFFGLNAGYLAVDATASNFFGPGAGENATLATASNFFGTGAGSGATEAGNSNFFGTGAGFGATSAFSANFFGQNAGNEAINANNSNFFGDYAGSYATKAGGSNFFGVEAGTQATDATFSNFFGTGAGAYATNAYRSNFFGYYAGNEAINANNSNFFGPGAGGGSVSAAYSNFFGYQTGSNDVGANNIIIGTNITLPTAAADGINIGGVLFGTGTYNTTTGVQSAAPTADGKIGIGVVTPHASAKLEVASTTGGVLFPRLTTTERNAIASPANGLMIYNSTTNKFQGYAGGAWVDLH